MLRSLAAASRPGATVAQHGNTRHAALHMHYVSSGRKSASGMAMLPSRMSSNRAAISSTENVDVGVGSACSTAIAQRQRIMFLLPAPIPLCSSAWLKPVAATAAPQPSSCDAAGSHLHDSCKRVVILHHQNERAHPLVTLSGLTSLLFCTVKCGSANWHRFLLGQQCQVELHKRSTRLAPVRSGAVKTSPVGQWLRLPSCCPPCHCRQQPWHLASRG